MNIRLLILPIITTSLLVGCGGGNKRKYTYLDIIAKLEKEPKGYYEEINDSDTSHCITTFSSVKDDTFSASYSNTPKGEYTTSFQLYISWHWGIYQQARITFNFFDSSLSAPCSCSAILQNLVLGTCPKVNNFYFNITSFVGEEYQKSFAKAFATGSLNIINSTVDIYTMLINSSLRLW